MKIFCPITFILFFATPCFSQQAVATVDRLPAVASGSFKRLENFQSKYVEVRNVDVWFPEGYSTQKKYPVLYMQDGQMLFDSTTTWNHLDWGVDDVAGKLIKEKKVRPFIVVGIWNTGAKRHIEYFPQKPFESMPKERQDSIFKASRKNGHSIFSADKIQSDEYLKFVVTEVKPFIDSAFSVLKDRSNTFIAGSSMGALISLYAMCEYPEVFGGAACLSTHWPGVFTTKDNPVPDAIFNYLKIHLPNPVHHRIYFDHGTETLDALYPPLQKEVDAIMKAKGYTFNNWLTKEFAGATHSETAWKQRLNIPLEFLLKQK
jgi:enterochelin esterase-like enzyme